jgi:hypothetical protein
VLVCNCVVARFWHKEKISQFSSNSHVILFNSRKMSRPEDPSWCTFRYYRSCAFFSVLSTKSGILIGTAVGPGKMQHQHYPNRLYSPWTLHFAGLLNKARSRYFLGYLFMLLVSIGFLLSVIGTTSLAKRRLCDCRCCKLHTCLSCLYVCSSFVLLALSSALVSCPGERFQPIIPLFVLQAEA